MHVLRLGDLFDQVFSVRKDLRDLVKLAVSVLARSHKLDLVHGRGTALNNTGNTFSM